MTVSVMLVVLFVVAVLVIVFSLPPQVQGIVLRRIVVGAGIFSKIYYFMLVLWAGMCYTLHSESEVFTFSEARQ